MTEREAKGEKKPRSKETPCSRLGLWRLSGEEDGPNLQSLSEYSSGMSVGEKNKQLEAFLRVRRRSPRQLGGKVS